MSVNKGTLGSFTLDNEKMSNGKLSKVSISNDSTLYYGNSTVSLNQFRNCFSGLTSNPTTGQITLTRVDGPSVNFNIASLAFFQNQMAAAGQITTTTYGYNNATAYVTMKSGYGNTRTQTININPVYKKGQDSVTVNTFTTTDTYITFNANNKTLNNFTIHYALSNRVSGHTSFPVPAEKAYNAGFDYAADKINVSLGLHNI